MHLSKIFFLGFSLLIISCTRDSDSVSEPTTPDPPTPGSPNAPVETSAANTNYPSAFTGQTRVKGVRTTTAIQANIISSALVAPWGIVSLPDEHFTNYPWV